MTPAAHRSQTTLADGRRLYYYDDEPGSARAEHLDRRDLPKRPAAAQLRYDPLREDWVAVAESRLSRPHLPDAVACPLCPSAPGSPTEIPAPDYDVAVFENRFPSYSATQEAVGLEAPTGGHCDVVCFTSEHEGRFADLSATRVRVILDALADRTAVLSRRDDVAQVFCFENRGEQIGVTLHHPHGQIYAYPYLPTFTRQLLQAARRRRRDGADLFADVLAAERDSGRRVVAANADWTAFVPFAARWPFEVHVYPHLRVPDLAALPDSCRDSFAEVYLAVLRGFDALFDAPMPYIAGWHQAPVAVDRDLGYTHLQLYGFHRASGKLKHPAGSETAMGAFVNDVPPETAADLLREAIS